jgi:hypothetical protein
MAERIPDEKQSVPAGEKSEQALNHEPNPASSGDCAVDDSNDVDEDFIMVQRAEKILAEQRLKHRNSAMVQIQKAVPFHFSPLFLPLTTSNFDACVALENAAFTNPNFRCSPEKASGDTTLICGHI